MSFPEVPGVEARLDSAQPTASSALPPPHPHPCHCQGQRAWEAARCQGPGCEGHFSKRSPGGSSQGQGLTVKARTDGLLGPGQLVLLSHLLQDRQVLCSPRKIWDELWEPG